MVIENGYHPQDMLYIILFIVIIFTVYHFICYFSVKNKLELIKRRNKMNAYKRMHENEVRRPEKKKVKEQVYNDEETSSYGDENPLKKLYKDINDDIDILKELR